MLIVLNNKCNFSKQEFLTYQEELKQLQTDHQLVVCPSALYLPLFTASPFYLGAQNVSCQEQGAHTGEISASQLKSVGVSYAIVGHSERRQENQETNEIIQGKVKRLFAEGIRPILCVGESQEIKEKKQTMDLINQQLTSVLTSLTALEKDRLIIAYEPVWAIGTGLLPEVSEIDQVLSQIRELCPNSILLYGGSVNEQNIAQLAKSEYINGYLLGGLGLKPEKLQQFLTQLKK